MLAEGITQPRTGPAQVWHFTQTWELRDGWNTHRKKKRSQSRESEKYVEFMSNIVSKDSMQESDMIWQHCGEQLREG